MVFFPVLFERARSASEKESGQKFCKIFVAVRLAKLSKAKLSIFILGREFVETFPPSVAARIPTRVPSILCSPLCTVHVLLGHKKSTVVVDRALCPA